MLLHSSSTNLAVANIYQKNPYDLPGQKYKNNEMGGFSQNENVNSSRKSFSLGPIREIS